MEKVTITSEEIKTKVTEFCTTYAPENAPEKPDEAKAYCASAVDNGIALYNTLQGEENALVDDVNNLRSGIDALVEKFNDVSADDYKRTAKASAEGAMMFAIKDPFYLTLRVRKLTSENDNTVKLEVGNVRKTINLINLDKFCGGIGANKTWKTSVKKLWMMFIAKGILENTSDDATEDDVTQRLKDVCDCDFMKAFDKKAEGRAEYISNNKLLDMMRECFTKMIGEEFKPLKADVRYADQTCCFKCKKETSTVEYVTDKKFADIMLDICRRAVCQVQYDNKYKTSKKK